MNYVFSLEVDDFIELMNTLNARLINELEQKQEELLFYRWGFELPLMKEYITFSDYKKLAYKKPKQKVSEEESIEMIKRIEAIRIKHQERLGE